ncbi:phosphatidate cytidylyltransferase family protein [Coccidioides immitis H538.4]|uniref:dolichol kinase n=1 Tax=Coccidioides immitis H538.4 TaxID=396776 RepID=A0A0J8RG99_COCIT|nr:phosphatidate cytidylyltransferase family protein [Coccidioides immitis H538.4]
MASNDADNSPNEDAAPHPSHIQIVARNQSLRRLSRSPHPYRRRRTEQFGSETGSSEYSSVWVKSRRTSSDSGTDADDEGNGVLKGLPAPPSRRVTVGTDEDEGSEISDRLRAIRRGRRKRSAESTEDQLVSLRQRGRSRRRWRVEVLRRLCETVWILTVAAAALLPQEVRSVVRDWRRELWAYLILSATLYAILPLRIYLRRLHWSVLRAIAFFPFSRDLDPAPLIYPIYLPVLVALSLGKTAHTLLLPNIILCISSLPPYVVPLHYMAHGYSLTHWAITIVPSIVAEFSFKGENPPKVLTLLNINPEILVLLFPLHQAVASVLQSLVTTSLLPAEIPLLATGLINILLFAESPQAEIFKALLWLGGLSVYISCKDVLCWEIVLARIPSWKFRRPSLSQSQSEGRWNSIDRQVCDKVYDSLKDGYQSQSDDADGWLVSANARLGHEVRWTPPRSKRQQSFSVVDTMDVHEPSFDATSGLCSHRRRRHTFSTVGDARTTPSGRRKRSLPPTLRPFLSLTLVQARVRKWAYAMFVYLIILLIILVPVRSYISQNALQGQEPFGWAVGYLFGNIPSLRFWLVMSGFDGWASLPPWSDKVAEFCRLGWIEHLRRDTFGEANTRLVICAYCMLVLVVGMALVIRLSTIVEVDTRRKIFHGMMVAMFLPTTFVDPAFTALAMTLILAIFLLLELFRASQVPPISKPITYFLAPYIDGRDYRGPVIISHIFLLIGCGIPLWLTLAGARHGGDWPWIGWEIEGRDISMVSGVICVGMGDAAASLVGRRYGQKKWFWGGDKSLEGSFAFAVAVFVGIVAARVWLVVGGWLPEISALDTLVKAMLAAAGSSFTEAVLTGGNDNVVVPLVLWLLVRGMRI